MKTKNAEFKPSKKLAERVYKEIKTKESQFKERFNSYLHETREKNRDKFINDLGNFFAKDLETTIKIIAYLGLYKNMEENLFIEKKEKFSDIAMNKFERFYNFSPKTYKQFARELFEWAKENSNEKAKTIDYYVQNDNLYIDSKKLIQKI